MNTANKITLFRVILIPLFLLVCYLDFPYHLPVALAIFILASLSDFLDGYIARHRNQVTDFGKFMDPIADKVLVLSAMSMFVSWGRMPAWILVVVIARELAVSALRMIAVDNGRVIAAGWSGKVKTASTMVCICIMLLLCIQPLDSWLPLSSWVNTVCVWVIAVTTLYSGVEYFVKNRDVLNWNK